VLDSKVGAADASVLAAEVYKTNLRRDLTRIGLASDELLPSFSTLSDNIGGVPISKSVNGDIGS
jgi:hypothetical protein